MRIDAGGEKVGRQRERAAALLEIGAMARAMREHGASGRRSNTWSRAARCAAGSRPCARRCAYASASRHVPDAGRSSSVGAAALTGGRRRRCCDARTRPAGPAGGPARRLRVAQHVLDGDPAAGAAARDTWPRRARAPPASRRTAGLSRAAANDGCRWRRSRRGVTTRTQRASGTCARRSARRCRAIAPRSRSRRPTSMWPSTRPAATSSCSCRRISRSTPAAGRRHLDRDLVGLDLDQRLVLVDAGRRRLEPARTCERVPSA